jgi:hypothetical protein
MHWSCDFFDIWLLLLLWEFFVRKFSGATGFWALFFVWFVVWGLFGCSCGCGCG